MTQTCSILALNGSFLPSPLHPGAQEHYSDAEFYENRYQARTEDISYYLRKSRGVGHILEYGAGAGRLTLPLAQLGAQVTAVDSSEAMLTLLRAKLKRLPKSDKRSVSVRQGDMRTFRTKKRFDMVIAAFHTVCHLYSPADMDAFLRRSFEHLNPGGRLEFDLPLPRIDVPGYDPLSQVRVTQMEGPDGVQLLTQRWYQPQEVLMYLHYRGFVKAKLGSDFSSSAPEAETCVFTVSAERPALR